MDDIFGRVIAFIMLIVCVIFIPTYYSSAQQDAQQQSFLETSVNQFANTVKTQGKITEEVYFDLLDDLATIGVQFSIEIKHTHKSYDPVYDETQKFTDKTAVNYYVYYKESIIYDIETFGEYRMTKGDSFSISVNNVTPTFFGNMKNIFKVGSYGASDLVYFYGGRVQNEDF